MSEQINKVNEIWVSVRESKRMCHIVAISNLGNVMYGDGRVKNTTMYGHCKLAEGQIQFSQLIAQYFVPKSNEDVLQNRNCIDHITHNPIGMNVNDFRNLRWCTSKENSNFSEARHNMSQGTRLKPRSVFGRWFIERFPDGHANHVNEYAYYHRKYKESGELPTIMDYAVNCRKGDLA